MALVSLRQLLDHAAEHGYGVPAFNVNNLEQIQAIMQAADEVRQPVILQGLGRRAQVRRRAFSAPHGAGGGGDVPGHSRRAAPGPWRQPRRCASSRSAPASPA